MLARPAMRQELPAALRPDSSGLFTPPAEPFLLPPVDTAAPTPVPPPVIQPLSLAMLTDRLEFRSMDEPDEAPPERARPLLQSHMLSKSLPAQALGSLEAEERERAQKFRQLKALEYENMPAPSQPPIRKSSSIELPEPEIPTPQVENVSTTSAPALLEHAPSLLEDELVLKPDYVESQELPPLIQEQPPPRPAPMPLLLEFALDNEPPPPLISSTSLANGLKPTEGVTVIMKGPHRSTGRKNQSFSNKQATTRQSRGKSREGCRGRSTSKQAELFPDTLSPVGRPREAMQHCFQQLDSQEWEVTMRGLQTLVRLLRHHPEVPQAHLHAVAVSLGKQVRNLRSQVSRAACQTCGELFQALRRAVETELEEVVGPLFQRSADTNKFLRADCNAALDKMVDSITTSRAVAVIVAKGANHLNAVVRTVAARLLLSIVTKLGPERVMLSPRETRDKILLTGANFLTEGSLETRCFAKQLFRCLCTHSNFTAILTEVLPPAVMRNIGKTLQSLK